MSPIGVFACVFSFVNFLVPSLQEALGINTVPHLFYGADSLEVVSNLGLALLYFMICTFSFTLYRPRAVAVEQLKHAAAKPSVAERGIVPVLFCITWVSVISTLWLLQDLAKGSYATFLQRRTLDLPGTGYLLSPMIVGYAAAIFIAAPSFSFARMPRGWRAVATLLAISAPAFTLAFLGQRLLAAIGAVYPLLAYTMLQQKRLPKARVVGVLIAVFVGIASMGVVRTQFLDQQTVDTDAAKDQIYSPLLVINEFAASFGQLEWLGFLRSHEGQWERQHGATYVAALANPVPRSMWEAKPRGAGPILNHVVHPAAQVGSSGGMTTGCVLEAYLNGGIVGLVIVAGIHGMLLALVTNYGRSIRFRYQFVLYVFMLACVSEMLVYGEFYGVFTRIGILVVPILLYRSCAALGVTNDPRVWESHRRLRMTSSGC